MSVSLWISSASQFGELAPGESRQGALRQALAQAIQRELFGDAAAAAGPSYDQALLAFAKALSAGFVAPDSRPAAQSLWAALFPANVLESSAAASEKDEVPKTVSDAFCLGVHALCAALALQWVESPNGADDDTAEDDRGADDETLTPGSAGWQADYPHVLGALTALLRQAAWHWLRNDRTDETAKAEDLRLIAAVLLDTLLAVLGDWFAVRTGETRSRNGRPYTQKYIALLQPALAQRIERLLTALPFRFTVQPLKQPVAYRPGDPGPAEGDEQNYFRVDLIGYRRSNAFLRRLQADATEAAQRAPEFLRYVEAVNIQQAVPWRINRDLLHWARRLIAIGGGKAEPDPTAKGDTDAPAELRAWVHEAFYAPVKSGTRAKIERPGEFLDSPLADRVVKALCPAEPDAAPVIFYLPWKADYRGRIYAETPWLTPQGGDLQRALFEFPRGRVLSPAGVCALRRHGANLVRRRRLLEDLKIAGREVVTLEERERWVVAHEAEILASAGSPLTEPFWRQVSGKPMQFLAFCLAYRQWTRDPAAPVHLPVQIDGTCNGLQHIAALMGDAELARAVNVLPSADGLPGDIYSELATAAGAALGCLHLGRGDAVHRRGLELADAWLAASPLRRAWVNRETAKKVVMTIPYGASRGAQAPHVLEAIADAFEQQWLKAPPAQSELDELLAWKEQDQARRVFVATSTKGLFAASRRAAFRGTDELATLSAGTEWQQKRTFAAYVALAIVGHLHAVLAARYPSVNAFSGWLKKTAKAAAGTKDCAGLPLLWQSPLGFPVCQDKFALKGTSATARLGSKVVRIDVQRLAGTVDPLKQQDALLPNLIHSLDATHLAMTLLDAQARGLTEIGSIHDCLLCHPNDAAALGQVVRRSFARLYQPGRLDLPDPLIRWRDWMALLVELRAVPRRGELLAALNYPGEQAERDLDHDAGRGDRDATRVKDVLAAIRRRDPSERFLARMLLEYAVGMPTPEKAPLMPEPPGEAALRLGDGTISDYFFS
ncbi:DNA-directed RNA polymerase [uncultured Thiodictyon sp.]|uniref:DNA-directed RNA polymerase n=1 Tax=uncultured Thiodictyon sp. TaxID=1846217 RepID=UPI0025EE38DB|nr:DNA-directed RNA polymerase [uncultured Thiodictyon sp.]